MPVSHSLDERLLAVEDRLHAMRARLKALLIAETVASSSRPSSSSSLSALPSPYASTHNPDFEPLQSQQSHQLSTPDDFRVPSEHSDQGDIPDTVPPPTLPPLPPSVPPAPAPPPPLSPTSQGLSDQPPIPPPLPPPLPPPPAKSPSLEESTQPGQNSRIEQKLDVMHAAITTALSLLQSQPASSGGALPAPSLPATTPLKKKPPPEHAIKVFDARQAMLEELKKRIAGRQQSAEVGALTNYT